jgi:hydrogenase large subunit
VSLVALTHYFQALEFQRKATQIVAILGGKSPHIQNLAVGGVMNAINPDSLATLNVDRLQMIRSLFEEVVPFVRQVYFPDACAIAGFHPAWFGIGAGVRNYLAVPDLPVDARAAEFDLPGGWIVGGDLASAGTITGARDEKVRKAVAEDVTRAWYRGSGAQRPWQGETTPFYTDFRDDGKYTWVKAPRFDGKPMEVGPLAGVLVGYTRNHALTRKWTDDALGRVATIAGHRIGVEQLSSTMGRHVARAIRAAMLTDLALRHWERLADNIAHGDVATYRAPAFPSGSIEGVGLHEAPRGALSHWVVVKDGVLANYQAVVPTTWNASPRDESGQPGPYEAALVGTPVADPERPLEVLRTVHSFDPCMACACHTLDPAGRTIGTATVP